MKEIVSLFVLVVTGFLLLIFSFKALSMPLGERREAERLQVVIDQLDSVRREAVARYLDGDPLLKGNSYRSYDQARKARLNQMSYQELVTELKRLETQQIKQAARLAGIAIPEEEKKGNVREASGFGGTVRRGSDSGRNGSKSAYSSYMASYYEDLLKHQSGDSFDDRPHAVPDFIDPSHEEYTVTMPAAVTGSQPKSFKVRVSPGKMEMLKQKQRLDKILIDDVLRMTGKLP
ncbi:MAG: hypothetical protein ACR2PX_23520 [Endozoicomonas sp.]|uniref:hypothetical protein n=1 Tax=Endozoicomonas sp. TaxID=1892382 RepID=UPI003D9B1947